MLEGHLVLSPFPPGFRNPRFPLPAHAFSFRPAAVGPPATIPGNPTVYFTLGTVNNTTDLFSRITVGLRELPVNVVVTVGERVAPAAIGSLPDQPYNARRCVELGTAQVLDPVAVTPEKVRTAVSAVFADGDYRRAAEQVREKIHALPGPEQTIPLIEGLHGSTGQLSCLI